MKTVRIEIEKPCQQNWDSMPQLSGGLYCSQCTKVVTDFSRMSDEELIRTLGRKTPGETCGRFHRDQLEKIYRLPAPSEVRSYQPFKLLLAGLLSLRLSSEAQTTALQKNPGRATTVQAQNKGQKTAAHARSIKGKVFDRQTRAGLIVTLKLYASTSEEKLISTITTDPIGAYELVLPDKGLGRFFRIVYSSAGNYADRSVIVDRDKIPAYLGVSLQILVPVEVVASAPEVALEEVTIAGRMLEHQFSHGGINPQIIHTKSRLHQRIWYRCKRFFRKISGRK